ncbi:MAG TPA: hypothetical protein VG940_11865 [Gemmatimonadales bacterium]|nr:hypothetical protein [Gemmatimonadales bacterium]
MALDQLLAALEREAQLTVERLRAEARAEAERIATVSGAVVEHQRAAEVDRLTRSRRERGEAEVAAARREARREALVARARLLERVEQAIRQACPAALGAEPYRASLGVRLDAALAAFTPGMPVSARCASTIATPLLAAWPATRPGDVQADDGVGSGFVLADPEGRLEVEDTLEARLESRRSDLMREALRLLEVEP